MKARRKYLIGIAVVLAMLWPIKTLSAPAWDVTVVDESGVPVAGITVRESYQNYSAESTGHEEDQQTDIQGEAKFTRKTLSASLLQRVFGIARSATGGVHASFGPHSYVFAFGNGREGSDIKDGVIADWTGYPATMKSLIVAHSPSASR